MSVCDSLARMFNSKDTTNDATDASLSNINVLKSSLKTECESSPKKRQRTDSTHSSTDAEHDTTTGTTILPDSTPSTLIHSNPIVADSSTLSMGKEQIITKANESETAVAAEQQEEGRSKRERKPISYRSKFIKQRQSDTPRWYTQSYLVFRALREHPDHCLPRTALINAALALDEKISLELNLPRVFRSKTPSNSASAVLTTNSDRYYIPFKPEGSRSTWFKLSFTPGNYDQAYEEYQKWMTKLIHHDWLYCFGIPLAGSISSTVDETSLLTSLNATVDDKESALNNEPSSLHTTVDDKALNNEPSSLDTAIDDKSLNNESSSLNSTIDDKALNNEPSSLCTIDDKALHNESSSLSTIDDKAFKNESSSLSTIDEQPTRKPTKTRAKKKKKSLTLKKTIKTDRPSSSRTLTTQLLQQPPPPVYQLDQLDLTNVPKQWQDIVQIGPSTIPNGGQGLFAARELPYNTPLGFYFGVPMTESEFDSIKEHVGRASEYSILYRRTVLDATDDQGEPYTLPDNQPLCPFHFMNEAKDESMANILFVEGTVVNQVICWSKRIIQPGEELLVWYGTDVNRYWNDDKESE